MGEMVISLIGQGQIPTVHIIQLIIPNLEKADGTDFGD
jgi:hypothetical protein